MIAIIVALDSEFVAFEAKLSKCVKLDAPFVLLQGEISGKEVLVCQSGIGKTEAAMTITHLLNNFSIDLVINSGTAGGLRSEQNFKDLLIAETTAYHDMYFDQFSNNVEDLIPFTAKLPISLINLIANCATELSLPYHRGLLVSGDQFIQTHEQIDKILKRYPKSIAVDMESNSLAQVAKRYQTPFVVIRSLSDICLNASPEDYYRYGQAASINAAMLIENFLNKLDFNIIKKSEPISTDNSIRIDTSI